MTGYTLGALKLNATVLAIDSSNVDGGLQELMLKYSGNPDPMAMYLLSQKPKIQCSSNDITTMLNESLITPVHITTGNVATLYWQQLVHGGLRPVGSVNPTWAINEGALIPNTLTAEQGKDAKLSFTVYAAADSSHAPIVYTANQALPTLPTFTAFTCGPVDINSVKYDCLGWELDWGWNIQEIAYDGSPYTKQIYALDRNPRLKVNFADASYAATFANGVAVTAVTAYLRQLAVGGVPVADAAQGAAHIALSATAGGAYTTTSSGAQGESAKYDVIIPLTWDGANNIITMATGAIS